MGVIPPTVGGASPTPGAIAREHERAFGTAAQDSRPPRRESCAGAPDFAFRYAGVSRRQAVTRTWRTPRFRPTQPMHSTQPSQSTQPMQSTHRRQPTQPRQPTHAASAIESRQSTDPAIPALPDTPALPATATLPETPALPATRRRCRRPPALPGHARRCPRPPRSRRRRRLLVTPALPATATLFVTSTSSSPSAPSSAVSSARPCVLPSPSAGSACPTGRAAGLPAGPGNIARRPHSSALPRPPSRRSPACAVRVPSIRPGPVPARSGSRRASPSFPGSACGDVRPDRPCPRPAASRAGAGVVRAGVRGRVAAVASEPVFAEVASTDRLRPRGRSTVDVASSLAGRVLVCPVVTRCCRRSALSTSVPPIRSVTSRPDTDTTSTGTSSIRAGLAGRQPRLLAVHRQRDRVRLDRADPEVAFDAVGAVDLEGLYAGQVDRAGAARAAAGVRRGRRPHRRTAAAPARARRRRAGGRGGGWARDLRRGSVGRTDRTVRVSPTMPRAGSPVLACVVRPAEAGRPRSRRAGPAAPRRDMGRGGPAGARDAEAERAAGPAVDRSHLIRLAPA